MIVFSSSRGGDNESEIGDSKIELDNRKSQPDRGLRVLAELGFGGRRRAGRG